MELFVRLESEIGPGPRVRKREMGRGGDGICFAWFSLLLAAFPRYLSLSVFSLYIIRVMRDEPAQQFVCVCSLCKCTVHNRQSLHRSRLSLYKDYFHRKNLNHRISMCLRCERFWRITWALLSKATKRLPIKIHKIHLSHRRSVSEARHPR